MNELHDLRVPDAHFDPLDHWGCGPVCGAFCLISEPYVIGAGERAGEVLAVLRAVAELSGSVGVFSRESSWNPPGTIRLIWAPHPARVPELTRYDLSARIR